MGLETVAMVATAAAAVGSTVHGMYSGRKLQKAQDATLLQPPPLPDAKKAEAAGDEAVRRALANRKGRQYTNPTGGLGLAGGAPIQKKTLLGA